MTVDVLARLDAVDCVAERAGGAGAHRAHELVHPAAAGRDERRLVGAECGRDAVGAEAGVLADAAVVEDRHLLADVGVAAIGMAVGVLVAAEADLRVRPVAEWFGLRFPATAKRCLWWHWDRLAEPVPDVMRVGHEVGAVVGDADLLGQPGLELVQACQARLGPSGPRRATVPAPGAVGAPLRPALTSAANGRGARPQLGRRLGERPDRRLDGLSRVDRCADRRRRRLRSAPIRQRRR